MFESGQHPIIVGQAAYNSAYGSNFAAGSNCNAPEQHAPELRRFSPRERPSIFGFNTLLCVRPPR